VICIKSESKSETKVRGPSRKRLVACVSLFLGVGCSLLPNSPESAWRKYRRGSTKELPKASGPASERAEIGGASLSTQDGAWVISGGVLDFYRTDTPRQTLETFLLAAQNKRFDVLYRLMPSQDKSQITEEDFTRSLTANWDAFERAATHLRENINEPLRITGNTAAMFYPLGSAELIFEIDHWCVVSVR
jgi:hypothetical protein